MSSGLAPKKGYLEVTEAGPGIDPAFAAATGSAVAVGAGETFKGDVVRCNHCQAMVILNPDRTRERGSCGKCFRYICDPCAATYRLTLECVPVAAQIDAIGEALVLGKPAPAFVMPGGIFVGG